MATVEQPAGNYYDKYHTRNPIARALMQGFLRSFDALAARAGTPGQALEIGCGEGELSMRLARTGWRVQGCDIAEAAVDEARARIAAAGLDIPVACRDIAACREAYPPQDLVVCCEVLEHLDDPLAGLDVLAGLSRGHVLVSVPREPLWRVLNLARGRYLADLGNTPGHVQHWSRRAFVGMLQRRLDVVAVATPLPWTMALCRVRGH
jgi:2-polyprenyl-3-methyl-5-hydroxy-6-metoxy-1,4-benzoquinol methylase